MKNKYIQPEDGNGCSIYCLSNFVNQPLFEQLESQPWLGEMTDRKEEKTLRKFSIDEFRIFPILYHNSSLKYVSYQEIGKALKMVMDYPELQDDKFMCVMPLTIKRGVLHRIYLYVKKDRIYLSDPLQENIKEFYTVEQKCQYAHHELKMFLTRKMMYPYRLQIIGFISDMDEEKPVVFEVKDFNHLFAE